MTKKILAIATLVSCAAFALENLYAPFDGGVEQGDKFWRVENSIAKISANGGVGGSGALVLESQEVAEKGGFTARNLVRLQGGATYTVECKFTGEVKSGKAVLVAEAHRLTKDSRTAPKPLAVFASRPIDESVVGRWSTAHCTFELPEDADVVTLSVQADGFMGKLVFDDFALYESESSIGIPWFAKEPPMNGTLDAEFAAKAVHINDFQEFRGNEKHLHKDQTDVYVGMTNETLFGTFLMHHAPNAPLDSPKMERDGVLFKHDCVEMFLTFIGRDTPYFHFAFNAGGTIYDACDGNPNWSCDVKSACGKLSDSCDLIQFSIPLKNIGYNHAVDAGIVKVATKMNFARTHIYGAGRDYSCWSKAMGSFHDQDALVLFNGFDKTQGRTCSRRFWNVMAGEGGDTERIAYWPEKNPLYTELMSDTPNPLKGHAAYIWPRPLEQINVAYGIQYGFEYSRAEIREIFRRHGLHYFGRTYAVNEMKDWSRDTGIGICLYFPYYINDHKMSYDKATYDKAFADTRKILSDNPECFWGISLGDEDFEWFLDNFVKQANDKDYVAKTPSLQEAIKTVKEQFGFGKYGVPTGKGERGAERFEWLATKKYILSRTLQMQKDLYALCQEFKAKDGKPLVCISGDPMGNMNVVQQQNREKDYCDIFTGQVLPGADRFSQSICLTTKILKDLTGKVVWPCAHVEPYSVSNPVKATAIYLSEVARGGGTGLQIWNYDNAANERRMGNTCFDYYGHRPRWDYIMDVVDRFSEMNLLKFPEDDFAIYLSNDTFLNYKEPLLDGTEALFTFAGPSSKSWFKFISGTQLRDGELNLSKWKTIMIPYADIEFAANQKALMDYVKNGGTIVCFDPFAFSCSDDGADTAANREALFGARSVKEGIFKPFSFRDHPLAKGISPDTLFSAVSDVSLQPMGGTKVLAAFNDGKVAATVKEYAGGGRAILFAPQLQKKNLKFKTWSGMFTTLLNNLGVRTGHDIWRFTFPYEEEKEPVIKHKCLTGNYFYWYLNEAKPVNNISLPKGFYSYSVAPDGADTSAFTFKGGRLTNRLEAPRAGDYFNWLNNDLVKSGKLTWRNFADKWSKTDPLEIVVDFGKEVTLSEVKLFYNGDMPSLTVVADGKEHSVKGENTAEVRCASVELPSVKAANLILRIPARKDALLLSEMEVWGEP
ncbi:MAG: hypothetical protein J5833_03685 [Victivallales bacterium]|nr:hypothetical protein [Victivallales bacterium]